MKRRVCAIATAAVIGLSAAPAGHAAQLAADLSRDTVAITTGFVGDKVIFFGAADGPGNILIVVEGPPGDTIVRRKSRVSGIWINRDSVTFRNAPSFYAIAASGPLDTIISPHAARKFRIGLDNLDLHAVRNGAEPVTEGEANRFREALVRNQQRAGLFRPKIAKVILPSTGVRLFRTEIFFPSNVPTGVYRVRFLLLQDGFVIQRFERRLLVSKAGLSARVFRFAHHNSIWYGVLAIVMAVAAGWGASWAFGRK